MKFTGGYLLGALTVVGVGASFVAGFLTADYAYTKKNETAAKVSDATVSSMVAEFLSKRSN